MQLVERSALNKPLYDCLVHGTLSVPQLLFFGFFFFFFFFLFFVFLLITFTSLLILVYYILNYFMYIILLLHASSVLVPICICTDYQHVVIIQSKFN